MNYDTDIHQCIKTLHNGGLILYPTDTVWGIGCDATSPTAITKIFSLKKRAESKSMIILVADKKDLFTYSDPEPEILNYISSAAEPTTAIYKRGKNLPEILLQQDESIAIRIVNDDFCSALINVFGKPIVSTSANISGALSPANFKEISSKIKNGVDYIVQHRQDDLKIYRPSAIIKLDDMGEIFFIRS